MNMCFRRPRVGEKIPSQWEAGVIRSCLESFTFLLGKSGYLVFFGIAWWDYSIFQYLITKLLDDYRPPIEVLRC